MPVVLVDSYCKNDWFHEKVPGPVVAHGGNKGQQNGGQSQQRRHDPVDGFCSVFGLDLAAKAGDRAGPFGIGITAVPLPLVGGDEIRF